jgi:hypothetical protein
MGLTNEEPAPVISVALAIDVPNVATKAAIRERRLIMSKIPKVVEEAK